MNQPMEVLTSKSTVEWYTPPYYIELVKEVLGEIDLDPASCEQAQEWIKAKQFYTIKENGLSKLWRGKIFLNPPFDNTSKWIDYLLLFYENYQQITDAIVLVNSNLGYKWYENLWLSYPVCCVEERIEFIASDGLHRGRSKQGQTFAYLGNDVDKFTKVFNKIGRIILP